MAENKNPHSGHRARLKKRFAENGLSGFEDHNALELLLFYAVPQMDTNVLAHRLIDEFGSVSAVFDAPIEALRQVKGVGENTAVLLKLIPEICSFYEWDKVKKSGTVLNTAELAGKYFLSCFIGETIEKLRVVCMDSKCKVKKMLIVSEGDLNFTDVNIRKIVRSVLNSNSSSIILAHNHPSGVAAPSAADIEVTRNLIITLKKLDIRVNDHIIIGGNEYFSMARSNKFKNLF